MTEESMACTVLCGHQAEVSAGSRGDAERGRSPAGEAGCFVCASCDLDPESAVHTLCDGASYLTPLCLQSMVLSQKPSEVASTFLLLFSR